MNQKIPPEREFSEVTEVAVAIILRQNREFLLTQRLPGKPYEGYWEFPGGKLEDDETPLEALRRELHEELGIDIKLAYPWVTRVYDYPHAKVRLHFYRVLSWDGEPHAKESQQLTWQSLRNRLVDPILPANEPILKALRLPTTYAISNAEAIGVKIFMKRLDVALRKGLRFLQLREKNMAEKELRRLAQDAVTLAHEFGALVTINSNAEVALESGADGVHFTSQQLMEFGSRPDIALFGASCHNQGEIQRAIQIGADFLVLGPVNATPGHEGVAPLGWERFFELIRNCPLPVFALGGLHSGNLIEAWNRGGHGIAILRAAWPEIKPVTPEPAKASIQEVV